MGENGRARKRAAFASLGEGARGEEREVYNVAGVRVMSVKVEGAERSFELSLPKGCYIVKVGKVVRKISVK